MASRNLHRLRELAAEQKERKRMSRRVDITEKLSFDENPCLVIRGRELEVNTDAPTMLKVMGIMTNDDPGVGEIIGAYELVFPQASRDMIEKELKLGFNDLIIVVQEAFNLVLGEDNKPGEQRPVLRSI